MSNEPKYIASKHSFFREEEELFETYVGIDNQEMTLLYSAWGKTEEESLALAQKLAELLNIEA